MPPITHKNGYILWGGGGGGGGPPVSWGRRQWVGMKLQQQCHMQNTIIDLPQTCSIYLFYLRESANILVTATGELGEENENYNPLRKWNMCSSIIPGLKMKITIH